MKVKFHLPDFSGHFMFNLVFVEMLKNCPEYFREGVEIASVYGVFPPSIWNGGRTIHMLNLMEHYLYYMIKPEYKEEARFMFLKQLIANEVVSINE